MNGKCRGCGIYPLGVTHVCPPPETNQVPVGQISFGPTTVTVNGENYAREHTLFAAIERAERLTEPLLEIAVDVVLADDLDEAAQIAALWQVVRRHTQIAKEALDA